MAKKVVVNEKFVQEYLDTKGYPEVGSTDIVDQKWLQKFYKYCTLEQLADWVAIEGLEVKPTDSEAIYRMRLAMAVLYKHFPKAPSAKKRSKYADYTNEALLELALQNDVVFEICDDERILRMRAIMALRASKVIE